MFIRVWPSPGFFLCHTPAVVRRTRSSAAGFQQRRRSSRWLPSWLCWEEAAAVLVQQITSQSKKMKAESRRNREGAGVLLFRKPMAALGNFFGR